MTYIINHLAEVLYISLIVIVAIVVMVYTVRGIVKDFKGKGDYVEFED